jgi:hypothetical protein
MKKYYPHVLNLIRKERSRRSDMIKGAALLGCLALFIVGTFAASNYGHETYRYSALACTLQDKENCPVLALLD